MHNPPKKFSVKYVVENEGSQQLKGQKIVPKTEPGKNRYPNLRGLPVVYHKKAFCS